MPRRGKDYEIGDRLWESGNRPGEKWSAGRIVAIVDHDERPDRLYMLLRANNGTETIYTCLKDYECRPSIPRFMPRGVVAELAELAEDHELEDDGIDERVAPVKEEKTPPPKRPFRELPDEDLSDLDDDDDGAEPVFAGVRDVPASTSLRILPAVDLPKVL